MGKIIKYVYTITGRDVVKNLLLLELLSGLELLSEHENSMDISHKIRNWAGLSDSIAGRAFAPHTADPG